MKTKSTAISILREDRIIHLNSSKEEEFLLHVFYEQQKRFMSDFRVIISPSK